MFQSKNKMDHIRKLRQFIKKLKLCKLIITEKFDVFFEIIDSVRYLHVKMLIFFAKRLILKLN